MMKRNLLVGICVLLVALTSVFAASPLLSLDSVSSDPATVYPGDTVTFTATVSNAAGADPSTGVEFVSTDLTDGVTSLAVSIADLVPGPLGDETLTQDFTVTVPTDATFGTYTADLTATDTLEPTATDTLSYSFTVANPLSVSVTSIEKTIEDGQDVDVTFTITNSGSTALTNVAFSPSLLPLDDDDDEITLTYDPATIATLASGGSTSVTLNIDVENGYDVDQVTDTIVVSTTEGPSVSVPLTVNVRPLACEEGDVGDLSITIDEPDNDDEFEQGETIGLEIEVENNGDNDMDIIVEAVLWNTDENEAAGSVESDEENVDEDDQHTFDLDLVIDGDIDEDDDYTIFIIAYDDSNDDEQCISDDVSVDIEEQDYFLVIDEARVTPSSVQCGGTVQFAVDVDNQGAKDLDEVFARVLQDALGIDVQSSTVEIKDGDSHVLRVSAQIPEDANSQTYAFDVIADYGEQATETVSVKVTCDAEPVALATTREDKPAPTSSADTKVAATGAATTVQFDEATIFDRLNAGQVPAWFWLVGNLMLAILVVVLALIAAGGKRRR